MSRTKTFTLVAGMLGSLSLGALLPLVAPPKVAQQFSVEVSINIDANGTNPGGPPEGEPSEGRSTIVVVDGSIYPEGTIPEGEKIFDPLTPGGIGTWRCHFAYLGLDDAPLVGAVSYYFLFDPVGKETEESMLVVQGINSHIAPDESIRRVFAVVGGTGRYSGATGEVLEEVFGTNEQGSSNARFHFRLRDTKRGKPNRWDKLLD